MRSLHICTALMLAILFFCGEDLRGEQDNRFAYAQFSYPGKWDPYPDIHHEILSFIITTTSIKVHPDRKIIPLGDDRMFEYPFLILAGNGAFPHISEKTAVRIRQYLQGGGVLFIEDSSGISGSLFDREARRAIKKLFPESVLNIIPREHAVMRSFYLMRTVQGRRTIHNYLEGLDVDGRTCLIYSQNDMLGAWARDRLGNYVYAMEPGSARKRKEAVKMTANIIIFGLTGTYKTDAIHIPFILQKLRSHPY